jgi:hypothetical protein
MRNAHFRHPGRSGAGLPTTPASPALRNTCLQHHWQFGADFRRFSHLPEHTLTGVKLAGRHENMK